ncbi:MAG: formate dehydrogenase subunit delta [Candidatus Acidiferrales bacterium]
MVHMANQIAIFFASYPKEEAVAAVADHLKKFWEKRMRKQIVEYVANGGGGLHEVALEAVRRLQ